MAGDLEKTKEIMFSILALKLADVTPEKYQIYYEGLEKRQKCEPDLYAEMVRVLKAFQSDIVEAAKSIKENKND